MKTYRKSASSLNSNEGSIQRSSAKCKYKSKVSRKITYSWYRSVIILSVSFKPVIIVSYSSLLMCRSSVNNWRKVCSSKDSKLNIVNNKIKKRKSDWPTSLTTPNKAITSTSKRFNSWKCNSPKHKMNSKSFSWSIRNWNGIWTSRNMLSISLQRKIGN